MTYINLLTRKHSENVKFLLNFFFFFFLNSAHCSSCFYYLSLSNSSTSWVNSKVFVLAKKYTLNIIGCASVTALRCSTSKESPEMTRAQSCFLLKAFSSRWASPLFETCLRATQYNYPQDHLGFLLSHI